MKNLAQQFARKLPHIECSASRTDQFAYARDSWPLLQIHTTENKVQKRPDLIVWPASTEEVSQVHKFAQQNGIAVIPFGAGSGVCGGTYPLHGGIIMDLKKMDQIVNLDPVAHVATVQAGKNGQRYEEELNKLGLSCGHFPSSIYCSTVGGWVAARGAGQCSTQYGKIEDMVVGITWVQPDGQSIRVRKGDGDAHALIDLLIGSEGVLGTITEVELRVFELPQLRQFSAYVVPNVQMGVDLVRRSLQRGALPSVFRMYDPLDTLLVGKEGTSAEYETNVLSKLARKAAPLLGDIKHKAEALAVKNPGVLQRVVPLISGDCLCIFMCEGSTDKVEWERHCIAQVASELGAEYVGDGPGWTWLQNRYKVSYKQSLVYGMGGFVDTMEISAPFERLANIYHSVVDALDSSVLIMAHFSHAYRDGGSIYFTFVGKRTSADQAEQLYLDTWHRALDTVIKNGGSISHHHGVGMLKAKWMAPSLGPNLGITQQLKDYIDPEGMMNPGKLGLV